MSKADFLFLIIFLLLASLLICLFDWIRFSFYCSFSISLFFSSNSCAICLSLKFSFFLPGLTEAGSILSNKLELCCYAGGLSASLIDLVTGVCLAIAIVLCGNDVGKLLKIIYLSYV